MCCLTEAKADFVYGKETQPFEDESRLVTDKGISIFCFEEFVNNSRTSAHFFEKYQKNVDHGS